MTIKYVEELGDKPAVVAWVECGEHICFDYYYDDDESMEELIFDRPNGCALAEVKAWIAVLSECVREIEANDNP